MWGGKKEEERQRKRRGGGERRRRSRRVEEGKSRRATMKRSERERGRGLFEKHVISDWIVWDTKLRD